ncbi:hypothetical protein M6B38_374545 [Iris pallida]|uniref:Uncharacterized protein n=1 Tax=Iris pallida TaxID=29817 RepID=A0AAX6GB30_IRIPA|nr:hypothetical protein M6B38_374545 [Iris pallida]
MFHIYTKTSLFPSCLVNHHHGYLQPRCSFPADFIFVSITNEPAGQPRPRPSPSTNITASNSPQQADPCHRLCPCVHHHHRDYHVRTRVSVSNPSYSTMLQFTINFSVVRQTKHPNQHQPRLTATIPCRQSRYHHPESAASLGATLHRDAFLEMPLLRVPNDFAESCAPCAVVSTYRSLR